MARLIDADELLEQAKTWKVECGEYLGEDSRDINIVTVSQIERAPTIDAMKVVRCRDCKHFEKSGGSHCTLLNTEMGRHDFCNCAERRDAE